MIFIPVQGQQTNVVAVSSSELPEDPEDVLEILQAEQVPSQHVSPLRLREVNPDGALERHRGLWPPGLCHSVSRSLDVCLLGPCGMDSSRHLLTGCGCVHVNRHPWRCG
jgi:hypothetical protein